MRFIPFVINKGVVLTLVSFALASNCSAQFEKRYVPRQTHSELSRELIYKLEAQFEVEAAGMPDDRQVRQINFDRRNAFMEKVIGRSFIKDDSLETYVGNVLNRLVERSNFSSSYRRVLVLSSPHVNAVCYGQGIYAVTVGLLARLENEDQLAFILAHELAHDELGHLRTRIIQEADLELQQRARKHAIEIFTGRIDYHEVEAFRSVVYTYTRDSRKNELAADSMALSILRNAGYDEKGSASALRILEAPQSPKYEPGPEFFAPLHSTDYPFQDYWLKDRLSVFSKKEKGQTFLYSADSLETHPSIVKRKELVFASLKGIPGQGGNWSAPYVETLSEVAAFETVESAYKQREYDLALYHALQLHSRYPGNAYLISRIAKILIDVREAKASRALDVLVPKYMINHSEDLKVINSLLYNLTENEVGEIAFHMMSKNEYFDQQDPSHHYLLWKTCQVTGRKTIATKVARSYKERFRSGIGSFRYH